MGKVREREKCRAQERFCFIFLWSFPKSCSILSISIFLSSFFLYHVRRITGQEIGNIIKQWRGFGTELFSDADTFTIDFPKDANSDQKARILGATFLLNMMEFEKAQKDG